MADTAAPPEARLKQAPEGVQGERMPGGFILITGLDGLRCAVRQHSVAIIHDVDECRDETLIQLHGGHVVRLPCPLMKCSLGLRSAEHVYSTRNSVPRPERDERLF